MLNKVKVILFSFLFLIIFAIFLFRPIKSVIWINNQPGLENLSIKVINNEEFMNLLRRIYSERKDLYSDDITDFERVNLVRDWVYENTISAGTNIMHISTEEDTLETKNIYNKLVKIFKMEETNIGGFYCDGFSNSLTYLYQALGYKAASFHLRLEDMDTTNAHTLTIVQIDVNGTLKWIVEDATFNLTYTDENGNALTIDEIQKYLKQGSYKKCQYLFGNVKYRKTISEIKKTRETDKGLYKIKSYDVKANENNRYMYIVQMNIEAYEPMFRSMYPQFIEDGYQEDGRYLYLYPYYINMLGKEKTWHDELQRLIEILKPSGQIG